MHYKVKEIRIKNGFTQEELSRKSGVSRAIISKLESNEEVVTSTDTLKRIANALNVSVSAIFLDWMFNLLNKSYVVERRT